jgi:hypothetical protein
MAKQTSSALDMVPMIPIGGETPEELASIEKYREPQRALADSYERRNQLFDPTLLAMAQGLLAPTKSGRFGEALSNTAQQVGAAQVEEEKRNRESAAIRAQLAASEAMQYGERRKQRMGANLLALDQPMNEQEFQRYAMLVGPEAAAKMREIRDKMSATQREEAFRNVIPELIKPGPDGKMPTLDSMLAIAAAKKIDPKLVFEFYEKAMPKPVSLGEGASLVQPGLGGGTPTTLIQGQPKELDALRKARALTDPNTSVLAKQALAIELFGAGVDPKRVLTPGGEVTTYGINLINQFFPGLISGTAPSTPPARPTTGAPGAAAPQAAPQAPSQTAPQAIPQAVPQAASRPQAAPKAEEAAKTFGPGNYSIPQPSRITEAPTGFAKGSKEDLEARQQQTTVDAQRFNKVFESASEKGQAATRTIPTLETALRAVQSADYRGGVFARPEQFVNQIKTAFGIADNVDVSRMLKTAVVDQALREQVLQNLRASFGGNPTEGERAFLMSVNNISDPRELLTYSLMGKMAAAQKDAARYDYLRTYGNYGIAADATFDRWSSSKGPEFYYPPLSKAREQLLNSSAIAEQWKDRGGYQPDKYDYELRDGKWLRRPKQR